MNLRGWTLPGRSPKVYILKRHISGIAPAPARKVGQLILVGDLVCTSRCFGWDRHLLDWFVLHRFPIGSHLSISAFWPLLNYVLIRALMLRHWAANSRVAADLVESYENP
jgi:hypothetical protein